LDWHSRARLVPLLRFSCRAGAGSTPGDMGDHGGSRREYLGWHWGRRTQSVAPAHDRVVWHRKRRALRIRAHGLRGCQRESLGHDLQWDARSQRRRRMDDGDARKHVARWPRQLRRRRSPGRGVDWHARPGTVSVGRWKVHGVAPLQRIGERQHSFDAGCVE
jgi:hypothetical protein